MPDCKALFEAILNATRDPRMVNNKAGLITKVNSTFKNLTGFTSLELKGVTRAYLLKAIMALFSEISLGLRTVTNIQKHEPLRSNHGDCAEIVTHYAFPRDKGRRIVKGYLYARPITGYAILRLSSLNLA